RRAWSRPARRRRRPRERRAWNPDLRRAAEPAASAAIAVARQGKRVQGHRRAMSAAAARESGFEHPALFYATADEYLAATVPFIESALSMGEPVAAVVPTRNLTWLREALGSSSEKVLLMDMTEVGANPGAIIPTVLAALAGTHVDRRMHIIGEPIWPGRTELEYPACAQHEALVNRVFSALPVEVLCPYDLSGLAPQVIADAEATHSFLIDRAGRRPSERYDPDRITADCNRPFEPAPKTAIERMADRATL